MVFTNIKVPRSEFPQKGKEYYSKTVVKKSASIGANATIICGITIGEYSMIGSGAVVTKDVPPFSLVIGNPEEIVGLLDKKEIEYSCYVMDKNNVKITVIGLHVGLPLAIEFNKKFSTIGFDLDKVRIDELNNQYDRTNELSENDLDHLKKLYI